MIYPILLHAVHSQWASAWRQLRIALVAGVLLALLGGLAAPVAQATPGGPRLTTATAAWSCNGVYHTVQRGETIYTIAWRYGATAYRIAVCNGLSSYTVYVGQTILVPTGRAY